MAGTSTDATDAAAATAIDSDNDLQTTGDGATQQQPEASGTPPTGGLEQVMLLLTKLISQMPANIAAAVKVDKPSSHLDNVKLDNRNFTRIQTFTTKHND